MKMVNGWKYVSIQGSPEERGFSYGSQCADDFRQIQAMLHFFIMESYGMDWSAMIALISKQFKHMTRTKYPELYAEMDGIAKGCMANGCDTTVDEIIAWNFYMSIPYWLPSISPNNSLKKEGSMKEGGSNGRSGSGDHCSAFMAVGPDWTETGEIVCAHNSFSDFIDGQWSNIVLDVRPDRGHRFIMQTSPCWIWSGTDFFVTSCGIIGTETTIGGFNAYEKKIPIAYRIRTAMQYGNTLDEYCEILLSGNSGDYANSWLFGNVNTKEILRIELGLKYHNIERTSNGVFIGFNAPYDARIRNFEVTNSGFYDIRRHQGARMVRLGDLMDKYKGKLNVNVAQKIISDHYDVYTQQSNHPCSRTVCSHYDLDAREYMSQADRPKPFSPHGAVDGIVCDSELARNMSFIGRFGNSCGTPFSATAFCKAHRQYAVFCPYLKDRPSQPWTVLPQPVKGRKSKSVRKSVRKIKVSRSRRVKH